MKMTQKTLHIINGDSLVSRLHDIGIHDDQLVWREMLCEGKTVFNLASDDFKNARVNYLAQFEATEETYVTSFLKPLLETNYKEYTSIVLWFEYDVFCHINMIAALSYLKTKKLDIPIYLVCSGWIPKETHLKGLGELTDKQLLKHYNEKITLTKYDIMLANELWRLYCTDDHTIFKEFVTHKSSFPYLSNCISAHLKRFPDVTNGLNILETNILKIIKKEKIKSIHHLTGYVLQYQGYYGFGDLQIKNIIHKLAGFFEIQKEQVVLNRQGHLALDHIKSFYDLVTDDTIFGGCKKYEYCYHPTQQILTKHE
ncbi:DUF1835 domain-containing protein [uncultured Kordia sp.]|uniref:DUF1835 domain-containing protein n=1 Tax=uncultured Kordia sp. TaxID=507699 RepID=UPI00262ED84A|nr:DUF1835 domain-containing protein [uncultured Kordia sp.]